MRSMTSGLFPAVALMAMLAIGCGRTGAVNGLVTLDGEPLTTGVITFTPAGPGPSAYGVIGPDGQYELRTGGTAGLAVGEYVVTVAANMAAPEQTAGPWPVSERALPLMTPGKYAERDKTPLRATVGAGDQRLNFDLVSP
jgi:hypothetical protein